MLLWSFEGDACGYRRNADASTTWAVIAAGIHLFPFRTEKLSPPAPMVLGAQAPGRVGRRPPCTGVRDRMESCPSRVFGTAPRKAAVVVRRLHAVEFRDEDLVLRPWAEA